MRRAIPLLWVFLLAPTVGLAQPGGDAGAQLAEARRHMEEGQTLYVQGRYVEAAQEFLRAYELQPYSAFLYNAAVAYERFGHRGLAATQFERYLGADPGAPDRAEVETRVARLRAEGEAEAGAEPGTEPATEPVVEPGTEPGTGPPPDDAGAAMKSLLTVQTNPVGCRVLIRAADGSLVADGSSPLSSALEAGEYTISSRHPDFRTATTDPLPVEPGKVYLVRVEMAQGAFLAYLRVVANVPGADVFIDEREVGAVGQTPFSNAYPIGPHRVWVEKPGYRPVESEIDLTFGEDVTLRVDLQRTDFGYLDLRANVRGAVAFVDEERVGGAPIDHRLHAGRHVVRVEAEGYKTFEGRVTIAKGQRTRVDVRMRPTPSRTSAWISTGVAAVAFGVAGYLGLRSSSLFDELQEERQEGHLASDDPRIADGFLLSLGADIGFLVGTVVGGLAIYYFSRDPLPDSNAEARRPDDLSLRPVGGRGFAGFALGGNL